MNKRQSNMDSLLLKERYINYVGSLLAVVCDGVGSMSHGGVAASMAVHMLGEWFDGVSSAELIGLKMRDAIVRINAHIISEARIQNYETASTLSALLLIERDFYIAHVGDSRIYQYSDDALSPLTTDDVTDAGKLTSCIGHTEEIFMQYYEGASSGNIFLLCSDGLHKRMDAAYVAKSLGNLNKKHLSKQCESLAHHVIERGEQDNITVAIVQVDK